MADEQPIDLTLWLRRMSDGDTRAAEIVAETVYNELRRMARNALAREQRHHSLQPTVLVNEAFVRLLRAEGINWQDRQHFFVLAARMMRRIVVDYFRQRQADKRPQPQERMSLDDVIVFSDDRSVEALIVDEALDQLAEFDHRAARVVELRYFGGLTNDQIAEILDVAPKTVMRDWRVARDWLRGHYGPHSGGGR